MTVCSITLHNIWKSWPCFCFRWLVSCYGNATCCMPPTSKFATEPTSGARSTANPTMTAFSPGTPSNTPPTTLPSYDPPPYHIRGQEYPEQWEDLTSMPPYNDEDEMKYLAEVRAWDRTHDPDAWLDDIFYSWIHDNELPANIRTNVSATQIDALALLPCACDECMGTPEDTPPLKPPTTTSLTLTHTIRDETKYLAEVQAWERTHDTDAWFDDVFNCWIHDMHFPPTSEQTYRQQQLDALASLPCACDECMGTPEDTPPLKPPTTTSLTLTHAIREVQQPKRKRFPFLTRHWKTTATVSAPRIPDSAPTLPTQSPPKKLQTCKDRAEQVFHSLGKKCHAPQSAITRIDKQVDSISTTLKSAKTTTRFTETLQDKPTTRRRKTTQIRAYQARHDHYKYRVHFKRTTRACGQPDPAPPDYVAQMPPTRPPQNPYTTQGPTTGTQVDINAYPLCAYSSPWPPHAPSARYAIVELVRSRAFLTLAERGSDIKPRNFISFHLLHASQARRCNRYILATITTVPTKLLIDRQTLSGRENP